MTVRHLENLIIIEKDNDVIVIVPAEDVLLSEVKLPKLSRHKLQQALPYALEELLVGEVGELHFAILNMHLSEVYPVAIVSHKKMQQWLAILKENAITPTLLLPATLVLPYDEHLWKTYTIGSMSLVRTGKFSGFAADAENLSQLIGENSLTESLTPDAYDALLLQNTFDSDINLLQGSYAVKRKRQYNKNLWKYAGATALAWISLVFLSNIISFFILHRTESKLNQQLLAIYQHQFPHAQNMNAPKERMAQKLKDIEMVSQKNNFLSLLGTVAAAFKKNHAVRILDLSYQQPILTLNVSAGSFDALDIITENLTNAGLTVKQQNALTANTQVKATLVISAGTV